MKLTYKVVFIFFIFSFYGLLLHAQCSDHQWCGNPDNLTMITVEGKAVVDTDSDRYKYYLDIDEDTVPDYRLNFGPYWYEPPSDASRPEDGQLITIYGGVHECPNDCQADTLPTIIVYEIDGQPWRIVYDAVWNLLMTDQEKTECEPGTYQCYTFPCCIENPVIITAEGYVLTDTTFKYIHYFLDIEDDGYPDYFLNFGPPWYEPVDPNLTYPQEGDFVVIEGALVERDDIPVLVVSVLNDLVWNDFTPYSFNFGGEWVHKNMEQYRYMHTPFDPNSGIVLNPGWHNGDSRLPDSLFIRVVQIYPENIPWAKDENAFAAIEIAAFTRNKTNILVRNHSAGLDLSSELEFNFIYHEMQLLDHNIAEDFIEVKVWNSESNGWQSVSDASYDSENNKISFNSFELNSLVIFTGKTTTNIDDLKDRNITRSYELLQNYPNPFNPSTVIRFILPADEMVTLAVYNVLGQKIQTLVNQNLSAGIHQIEFQPEMTPSGVYFYRLAAGNFSQTRKMILLR